MHKAIIVIAITLCCAVFALWDMTAKPKGKPFNLAARYASDISIAPDISFRDIDGKAHTLKTIPGVGNNRKTILINFWATWCTPCIKETPQLFQLAEREKDNIILIMISVDKNVKDIKQFFDKLAISPHQSNVVIGHDPDKTISKGGFGTTMYPETFVIAPDMTIKGKIVGAVDWLGDDVYALIHN